MSSTPSFFGGRLVIGADAFAYNGKRHAYADVAGLEFKHRTLTARADSGTGPMYVVMLRVLLKNGKAVTIRPADTLRRRVRTHDKVVFDTLKAAADWLGAYTFDQRMDGYEAELKQHGYVSWGKHQITPRGDLFYRHAYCMNLLPSDIRCMLYPFHMACLRRPHAWWKRVAQTFIRNGEIVDLRRDRDCFLYFARRYVGLTWPNETLRVYRGIPAEGVKEQPKDEPKAQTQEQPRAQQQEQPRQEQRREAPPPPPPPRAKTMPSHVQHLATLGLSPDVPWDTVKTRYRQLVRQHHPDLMRGKGAKEAVIKQAEETLKGINEAYAWLEDFYKMK